MSNWLTKQLTSAKQDSGMWSGLAEILQGVVSTYVDPYLTRLSNRKSIFTMAEEDLDTRVSELGSFFTIRSSDASSVPMLLLQRMDEIHFKGSLRPVTQTFYREFNGVPITWQPLYAPVNTDSYPYGTILVTEQTLDSVGDNYGDMFMTSRGAVSIDMATLMALIEADTTGTMTQESITADALEKFTQVVKPLLPLHIVWDGMILYFSVDLSEERTERLRLISISQEAGAYAAHSDYDRITSATQDVSHSLIMTSGGYFYFTPRVDDQPTDVDMDTREADIVDLTADTLDSRIQFSCASQHAYWQADGTLGWAAADAWPVEYVDGVAVGRHEPEKAATNLQTYSRADAIVSGIIVSMGTTFQTGTGPDGGTIAALDTDETLYAVYDATDGTWIQEAVSGFGPAEWTRYKTAFSTADAIRTYFGRKATSDYAYAAVSGLTDGTQYVTSHYRKLTDSALLTGFVQVEEGSITTSPIVTTAAAATREAATVKVTLGDAYGLLVRYSDGTYITLTSSGSSETVTLPQSALDWGTRYITSVQFLY